MVGMPTNSSKLTKHTNNISLAGIISGRSCRDKDQTLDQILCQRDGLAITKYLLADMDTPKRNTITQRRPSQ